MKQLSIFIDESGNFGEVKERPAYYLVSFVFHDQAKSIAEMAARLEDSIQNAGFDIEYIHTGPVIRREDVFNRFTIDERRKLIFKMLNFFNSCPINCETVCVNRKEATDKVSLSGKIARAINDTIASHRDYFSSFDKVIVYYDNGQIELSSILNAVLSIQFNDVEFRKAEPQKYRLLQAADLHISIFLIRVNCFENS